MLRVRVCPQNCHIGLDLHLHLASALRICMHACVRVLALNTRGRATDSRALYPRIYRICRPCTYSLSCVTLSACMGLPVGWEAVKHRKYGKECLNDVGLFLLQSHSSPTPDMNMDMDMGG